MARSVTAGADRVSGGSVTYRCTQVYRLSRVSSAYVLKSDMECSIPVDAVIGYGASLSLQTDEHPGVVYRAELRASPIGELSMALL